MVGHNAAFAEESAEVQVLQASLTKTKDLTKRIKASLSRLDASGKTVRDAIGPIYNNTQQLQITTRNIDCVNEAIDKLRLPSATKEQEERIIRAGPRNVPLPDYLGAMRRIDRNLNSLTATNLRINQQEISEFHGLLTLAVNQLLELYRDDLKKGDVSIEPLHYITKNLPFPVIPQERAQSLGQLAQAIVSASAQTEKIGQRDDDPGVKIYAESRGEYLYNSLQNLAAASISTSKRGANDTTIYRSGTNAIGTYAQGLEGMFLAEYDNIQRIFKSDTVGRVFGATCSKALSTFSKTLAELNGIIKSRILTDCFLAYEIIDLITPLSYRFEKKTGQLRAPISDALRPIRDTARSSLGEILSRTRSQADQVTILPPDGNTIPLVHETAARFRALGHFDKPLLHLLTSIGDGGWRKDGGVSGPGSNTTPQSSQLNLTESASENLHLLTNYIGDVIDTLMAALTTRSAQIHRVKPIQGIFLLNSIAVLTRAVMTSQELAPYVSASNNSIVSRLDLHRKPATSAYMSVWREPSNQLLDTISTSSTTRPTSGSALDSQAIIKSLSSKDKDKIKEKFRSFTQLFDEQVARHKSLHMEREVSVQLQRDIAQQIEPLYARYWDRYHELDKGKGKTVKYSKAELAQVLAGL